MKSEATANQPQKAQETQKADTEIGGPRGRGARVHVVEGARGAGRVPANSAGVFLRRDLELHALFGEEMRLLWEEQGKTWANLADELDAREQTLRSYAYSYDGDAGNGSTLRRVLRIPVVLARFGRSGLLDRVCEMAGYMAVPVPTCAGDEIGEATAAAEAMRECGEAVAEYLNNGGDRDRALAEIRQAQVKLAQLEVIVRERREGRG